MRRHFIALPFFVLIGCSTAYSQYFQFSQYNFSSQRVNPAQIGLTKYAGASALYRNQKTGGDFNLSSNLISAYYPLLNQSTGKPWSGIGVSFMDDRSAGIYKTQEAALSYAINVRLTRFQTLSFGAKTLYRSQRISYDGFYTGSQYVPDRGFNEGMSNGENNAGLRNNMTSLSAGLYWQQVDRRESITAYWGLSLFDFNRPHNSALNNESHQPASFVFTGGFQAYRDKKISILPELIYTLSSSNHLINLGARIQYELESTSKQVVSRIDVITKYVPGRSGIVGLQLHREVFSAGISYDFPILIKNAGNLGALEIGLEIRKPVATRAKKLQAKRKTELDKKKIASKNSIQKTTPIVAKKDSIKTDTLVVTQTAIPAVEIIKTDSSLLKTSAEAGQLSQEALLKEKITLHFGFEFNSIDLDEETENFLSDLSVTLKEDESLNLLIIGHTDNVGSEKFNQRLSQKRATSIKDFLIRSGISESRLKSEGKGLLTPLVPNDSDENRAKNRRVEIKVYYNR